MGQLWTRGVLGPLGVLSSFEMQYVWRPFESVVPLGGPRGEDHRPLNKSTNESIEAPNAEAEAAG